MGSLFSYFSNTANASTRRLIIVGKSENGKSTTGNSILGHAEFKHGKSLISVTKSCELHEEKKRQNKLCYNVCDTPGLLDSGTDIIKRALEVQRSVEACSKPHAFLIVFSTRNRMTTDEDYTIDLLRVMFGEDVFKHCIIVFTHGYDNISSDADFENFYKASPMLVELLKRCGGRIVRIENRMDDVGSPIADGIDGLYELIEQVSEKGTRVFNFANLDEHSKILKDNCENNYSVKEATLSRLQNISKKLKRDLGNDWVEELIVLGIRVAVIAGATIIENAAGAGPGTKAFASGVKQIAVRTDGKAIARAKQIAKGAIELTSDTKQIA